MIEQLELDRPVLVAWSYGGYVVTDYLRAYGETAIVAGIDLVGGAVLRTPTFEHIGPGLLENAGDACAPDLPRASPRCGASCAPAPCGRSSDDDWSTALCWNMVVPPEIEGRCSRARSTPTTSSRASPSRCSSRTGAPTRSCCPSMAEHVLEVCPTAQASWYDGVGHMPFVEDSDRFDRELAELVRQVA